jgi:arginyl-tRNA synthetase
MTQQVIDDALSSGAARRDADGAVIVDVAGLPTFLLRRSDGGTLYHTRDLATIKFRQDTYHPANHLRRRQAARASLQAALRCGQSHGLCAGRRAGSSHLRHGV